MRESLRKSWLPTLLFAAATYPLYLLYRLGGMGPALGPSATMLVLLPIAWNCYVLRSGRPVRVRALIAGAACAYWSVTLPHQLTRVWDSSTRMSNPRDPIAGLEDLILFLGGFVIAAPLGALLGVLIAQGQLLRESAARAPEGLGPRPSQLALRSVMVAVLLTPVLSPLAFVVFPELFGASDSTYDWRPANWVALSWIILLPAAAFLGWRHRHISRRLRRTSTPWLALLTPALVIGSMHGARWALYTAMTSAILTPLIWPARSNRGDQLDLRTGITAGAVIGGASQLIPTLIAVLWGLLVGTSATSGMSEQAASDPSLGRHWASIALAALVGAPIGGLLGQSTAPRHVLSGRAVR